jgi:hypothetical protein
MHVHNDAESEVFPVVAIVLAESFRQSPRILVAVTDFVDVAFALVQVARHQTDDCLPE